MSLQSRNIDCGAQELESILATADGSCKVIDVREWSEYAGGRIPGSRWIPLGELEQRAPEMDPTRMLYVVCRTGRRSAEAKRKFLDLGFSDVRSVNGGLEAWRKAGLAVERDRRAPWSIERQVRFAAGALVFAGVLLSVFVAEPFIWLSGFVGAGLVFAAATDTCAMGMLLMRMPWNRCPRQ